MNNMTKRGKTGRLVTRLATHRYYPRLKSKRIVIKPKHKIKDSNQTILMPILLGVLIGVCFGTSKPKFDLGKISGWLV